MRELVQYLDEMKCCDMVRERVLRLNKTPEEGRMLYGWHRKPTYRTIWDRDIVGKGEFIRKLGREKWEWFRNDSRYKRGRREYVSRTTFIMMKKRTENLDFMWT